MSKVNGFAAALLLLVGTATVLSDSARGAASLSVVRQALPAQETATAEPLPDLTGFAWEECNTPGTKLQVQNIGRSTARAFIVRSESDSFEWRIESLAAGESVRTGVARLRGPIRVDADNEVRESDENNNVVGVVVPGCHWYIPVMFKP